MKYILDLNPKFIISNIIPLILVLKKELDLSAFLVGFWILEILSYKIKNEFHWNVCSKKIANNIKYKNSRILVGCGTTPSVNFEKP